jgi:hypothetical protein
MDQDQPSKMQDQTAATVCERAQPGEEARGLLSAGMSTRAYLDALLGRGLYSDALRVLAHALPKRAAVWWAYVCAAEMLGPEPAPAARAALDAARAWVIDPEDEVRRAAFPAAEAAGLATPAGCIAMAAYLSGGSLAPPQFAAVPPDDRLTAKMVASALKLAAVIKEPEKAPEKYAAILRIGLEVADGRRPWPSK